MVMITGCWPCRVARRRRECRVGVLGESGASGKAVEAVGDEEEVMPSGESAVEEDEGTSLSLLGDAMLYANGRVTFLRTRGETRRASEVRHG